MGRCRHVRLFKYGRNQAARVPREMELPRDEAVIYRDRTRLIIEPTLRPSLSRLLATRDPVETDAPQIEHRQPEPVEMDEPSPPGFCSTPTCSRSRFASRTRRLRREGRAVAICSICNRPPPVTCGERAHGNRKHRPQRTATDRK